MKAAAAELVMPTREEARNGWTSTSLVKYLRTATSTDYEFHNEVLLRARQREHDAERAVSEFKNVEDLEDKAVQKELKRLEQELSEARAAVASATEQVGAAA